MAPVLETPPYYIKNQDKHHINAQRILNYGI